MVRPPALLLPPLLLVAPLLLAACAGADPRPVQVSEVRCRDAADAKATALYSDYLQDQTTEGRTGGLGWLDFRSIQPDC